MTKNQKRQFEWNEVADIFCIREGECEKDRREALMRRINGLTDKYGREYVIRKIALKECPMN